MFKNISLLSGLKIRWKLILIAVAVGLPLPFIAQQYVAEKNAAIAFSQKEVYGAQYLPPVFSLARELGHHRELSYAYAQGLKSLGGQILDSAQLVDRSLSEIESIDQKQIPELGQTYGTALQATTRYRSVQQKWKALKSRASINNPKDLFAEHTAIIKETLDLIISVADYSNLTLDPDIDTYYLMDTLTTKIPQAIENVSTLRGLSAGNVATKQITAEERANLTVQSGQTQAAMDSIRGNLAKAVNYNRTLEERYAGQIDIASKDVRDYLNNINMRFVSAPTITTDAAQFFQLGTQVNDRLINLSGPALEDLIRLINVRVDRNKNQRNLLLGLIGLAVLGALVTVYLIARSINAQTASINSLIASVENGNYDERAAVLSGDELGRTALAFNKMLDNTKGLMQSRDERDRIQQSIMKLLEEVSSVAEGDLTAQAEVTEDMTGAIADSFNYMLQNLRELIGKVQVVSTQVTQTTGDTVQVAERLAQGSQEQAERISHTSQSLLEMTQTIHQVNQHAEQSALVAERSLQAARYGKQAVTDTMKGMERIQEHMQETARRIRLLGERSEEIEEIVRIIEEIADRTGVLALNASIQASAAGQAGHGFGVVATEVEHLAGRSTEATKRISSLVRAIQGGTNEAISAMDETRREVVAGSQIANQAGQSLQEIEDVSARLSEQVRSISATLQEHAKGSEQLSVTMNQIASLTNQTTNGVMQSALTVKNLATLADELRTSVASFKIDDQPNVSQSLAGANTSAFSRSASLALPPTNTVFKTDAVFSPPAKQ